MQYVAVLFNMKLHEPERLANRGSIPDIQFSEHVWFGGLLVRVQVSMARRRCDDQRSSEQFII